MNQLRASLQFDYSLTSLIRSFVLHWISFLPLSSFTTLKDCMVHTCLHHCKPAQKEAFNLYMLVFGHIWFVSPWSRLGIMSVEASLCLSMSFITCFMFIFLDCISKPFFIRYAYIGSLEQVTVLKFQPLLCIIFVMWFPINQWDFYHSY